MTQLLGLAALAVVVWLVWRGFTANRAVAEVPQRDAKTLERDPTTGIYKSRERDGS